MSLIYLHFFLCLLFSFLFHLPFSLSFHLHLPFLSYLPFLSLLSFLLHLPFSSHSSSSIPLLLFYSISLEFTYSIVYWSIFFYFTLWTLAEMRKKTVAHLKSYDVAGRELFLQALRLMRSEMTKRYSQVRHSFFLFPSLPLKFSSVLITSYDLTLAFFCIIIFFTLFCSLNCLSWIALHVHFLLFSGRSDTHDEFKRSWENNRVPDKKSVKIKKKRKRFYFHYFFSYYS